MKANDMWKICDAVNALAEETSTDYIDILEHLIGVCWDEEEAGEIELALMQ
jgi:hypothetical protein